MSETMAQRMEKRDCNNHIYLKNLVESLEQAKVRKDIERIILYASELERYKIVCGNSPVIQQFEASIRRVSEELGLTNYPAIERAMSTHPQRLCQCDTCEEEEHPNIERGRTMGFRAMLDAATGTIERNTEEEQPNIKRGFADVGFRAMLDAAAHGTSEKNEDDTKPIVRNYGMGFIAMLDGATHGTIERSFQTEAEDPPIRRDGFLGMLESMYKPQK
jgi:hypothetical protein